MNNQYSEYFKPLSRSFTLASVKKMAVQEEGYLVQANAFRAGGCFCIRFRKKRSNFSVVIIIEL
jgi:hypothetical protein